MENSNKIIAIYLTVGITAKESKDYDQELLKTFVKMLGKGKVET